MSPAYSVEWQLLCHSLPTDNQSSIKHHELRAKYPQLSFSSSHTHCSKKWKRRELHHNTNKTKFLFYVQVSRKDAILKKATDTVSMKCMSCSIFFFFNVIYVWLHYNIFDTKKKNHLNKLWNTVNYDNPLKKKQKTVQDKKVNTNNVEQLCMWGYRTEMRVPISDFILLDRFFINE